MTADYRHSYLSNVYIFLLKWGLDRCSTIIILVIIYFLMLVFMHITDIAGS